MDRELEGLIAHLLLLISCAGKTGYLVTELLALIQLKSDIENEAQPLTPRAVAIIWGWLSERGGIIVRGIEQSLDLSTKQVLTLCPKLDISQSDNEQQQPYDGRSHNHDDYSEQGCLPCHASDIRAFASDETTWEWIAGHSADYKRLPKSEWELLQGIASTLAGGILQGDLGRLVNQDKRSVPKRTDALVRKGYITKRTTLVHGTKTSKLWLRSFTPFFPQDTDQAGPTLADLNLSRTSLVNNLNPVPWANRWTGDSVDYTALATTLMSVLKEWRVLKIIDLKAKLGVLGMRWQMKIVAKMCRILNRLGVIQFVAAELADKIFKDCVRFVRDLEPSEWKLVLATGKRSSPTPHPSHQTDPEEGNADDVHEPNIAGEMQVSSCWTIDRPIAPLIVKTVSSCRDRDVTNPMLYAHTLGSSFTRYLSSLSMAMSSPALQPPHLKHLQLVKERVRSGKVAWYRYSAPFDPHPYKARNTASEIGSDFGFSAPTETSMLYRHGLALDIIWQAHYQPNTSHEALLGMYLDQYTSKVVEDGSSKSNRDASVDPFGTAPSKRQNASMVTAPVITQANNLPATHLLGEATQDSLPHLVYLNLTTVPDLPAGELVDIGRHGNVVGLPEDTSGHKAVKMKKTRGRPTRARPVEASSDTLKPDSPKPWVCEKCGGSWKNDVGLKYHLERSQTVCNPTYVPPIETPVFEKLGKKTLRSRRKTYFQASTAKSAEIIKYWPDEHNARPTKISIKKGARGEPCGQILSRKTRHVERLLSERTRGRDPNNLRDSLHHGRVSQRLIFGGNRNVLRQAPLIPIGTRQQYQMPLVPELENTDNKHTHMLNMHEISNGYLPYAAVELERVQQNEQDTGLQRSYSSFEQNKNMSLPRDATLTAEDTIDSIVNDLIREKEGVLIGGDHLFAVLVAQDNAASLLTLAVTHLRKILQQQVRKLLKGKVLTEHVYRFCGQTGQSVKCQVLLAPTVDISDPKVGEAIIKFKAALTEATSANDEHGTPKQTEPLIRGRRALPMNIAKLGAPLYMAQIAGKRELEVDVDSVTSPKRRKIPRDENTPDQYQPGLEVGPVCPGRSETGIDNVTTEWASSYETITTSTMKKERRNPKNRNATSQRGVVIDAELSGSLQIARTRVSAPKQNRSQQHSRLKKPLQPSINDEESTTSAISLAARGYKLSSISSMTAHLESVDRFTTQGSYRGQTAMESVFSTSQDPYMQQQASQITGNTPVEDSSEHPMVLSPSASPNISGVKSDAKSVARGTTLHVRQLTELQPNNFSEVKSYDLENDDIENVGCYERGELQVAFVAVRVLLGGADKAVDWGLMDHLFPGVGLRRLRRVWLDFRSTQAAHITELTRKLQTELIKAFQHNVIPMIDFDEPLDYDWQVFFLWVKQQMRLDTVELPSKKADLAKKLGNTKHINVTEDWRERLFHPLSSVYHRFEVATAEPATVDISRAVRDLDSTYSLTRLDIARSWMRSLCHTDEHKYEAVLIKEKLLSLKIHCLENFDELLEMAIESLMQQRVLLRDKVSPSKGRPIKVNEFCEQTLGKLTQQDKYSQAREFKTHLDEVFRQGDTFSIPYSVNDGGVMALMNMNAAGRIRLLPETLPNIPFGFEPLDYETRKWPKSYYHFQVQAKPTQEYKYNEGIDVLKTVARTDIPREDAQGAMYQWVDFLGELNLTRWTDLLGAICFVLATRGCVTVEGIFAALQPVIDEHEVRVIVSWGQKCGILRDIGGSGEGLLVEEWWWLAVHWQRLTADTIGFGSPTVGGFSVQNSATPEHVD